jgi:hypothetical protein
VGKTLFIAVASLSLLAGCSSANKTATAPAEPKWKGLPYRLTLDTAAVKPNPAGVTLPGIKWTANPEELQRRVTLVVHFDAAATNAKQDSGPIANQMVMYPVDIKADPEGALPADYLTAADKELSKYLGAYCVKGKIKVTVAMAQSSLTNQAGNAEMNAKRLSDWLPIDVEFKNPHPKC